MDEEASSVNNEELLSQILEELKTLNTNVSEYKEYVYKRNEAFDELEKQKAEEEEKAKEEADKLQAEQEQAEQDSQDAEESLSDDTLSKLTDIHTVLSDLDSTYKEVSTSTSSTMDNLEYNSNMQFVTSAVGIGLLAILLGFIFARTIFRKL